MKTLTAATTTAKNLKGSNPRILVEIDLPGGTRYLAEEDITFNGQAYLGLIVSVGAFRQTSLRGMDSLVLEVSNLGTPQFSTYVESTTPASSPEKSEVRIYQHFVSITPDDPANLVTLFRGVVDTADITWTQDTVTIPCIDRTIEMPDVVGTVVTEDNLPTASPDAYGKILPIVYGAMERVPAIPSSVLAVTKLYGSLPASDASAIEVEDTTDFAATGQIDIDEERITYTGLTATTFTGITRGASITVAADHSHGTDVRQVGTERYIVAGHAVKTLTTAGIKVGPKLQTPVNLSSVSASDAASFPAIGTVATATFDGKPTYKDVRPTPEDQEVGTTAAGGANTASDPTFCCADHANYEESNFATLAPGQTLHVARSGAVSEAGDILKAWAVVRWFGERGVEGSPLTGLRGPLNVTFKPAGGAFTSLGALDLPKAQDAVGKTDGATGRNVETIDHSHATSGGTVKSKPMVFISTSGGTTGGFTQEWLAHDGSETTSSRAGAIPTVGGTLARLDLSAPQRNVFPESSTGTLVRFRAVALGRLIGGITGNDSLMVSVRAFGQGGPNATKFAAPNQSVRAESNWVITSDWDHIGRSTDAFFKVNSRTVAPLGNGDYHAIEAFVEYEVASGVSPLANTKLKKPSNPIEQYLDITSLIQTAGIGDWSKLNGCEIKIAHAGTVGGGNPDFNAFTYEIGIVVEHFPYTLVETEEVYADMDGWDDTSGHVTGAAGTLLDRPAHVWHHFVEQYGTLAHGDIDATVLAATHASLNALPYVWALALVGDPPKFDAVMEQMARECRSWSIFEAGIARLLYQATPAPAAVKSISQTVIRDGVTIERVSLAQEHVNLLTVQYAVDLSANESLRSSGVQGRDRYASNATDEVAASRAAFGDYPRKIQLDFVRGDATAANLLAYLLAFWGTMRRLARFSTHLDQLELERSDVLTVTYPLVGLTAPGTDFRIEAIRRTVGQGIQGQLDMIEFEAREA